MLTDTSEAGLEEKIEGHSKIVFALLKQGRHAQVPIKPEYLKRLGVSYMSDFNVDPWGNTYLFLMGPLEEGTNLVASTRENSRPDEGVFKTQAAPSNKVVYILSRGNNGILDQHTDAAGDDLGNW
jgi:hypothetical protein